MKFDANMSCRIHYEAKCCFSHANAPKNQSLSQEAKKGLCSYLLLSLWFRILKNRLEYVDNRLLILPEDASRANSPCAV